MKILFKPRPNGISWKSNVVNDKEFILYKSCNRENKWIYACYKHEKGWDNGQFIRDFDSIKQAQDWILSNIDSIK